MYRRVLTVILALLLLLAAWQAGAQDAVAPVAGTAVQPATPTTPARGPFAADAPTEAPIPDQPIDPEKVVVSISFTKADLTSVLAFLSLASGVPVVVDADVKGMVTISSMKKVPLTLAYEVINAALYARGYTMVGTLKDTMIRVVPLKRAVSNRVTVQTGTDLEKIGTSDALVTQVIPVQYISAIRLKDELKPLVASDQANLLAVSSTNTLIITDTEGNVRRLVQIINLLDTDTSDTLSVEVYQCKFATATVLISALEKVFSFANKTVTNQPGQPAQPNRQPGRPPGQEGASTPSGPDDGLISLKGELHLAADDRTNAIIISASRPKIEMVLALVKKLDINTTSEVRAKVFRLQYADAAMVATQLNTLFEQPQGGATSAGNRFMRMGQPQQPQATPDGYAGLKRNVVTADVRTNSVVVTATEQNLLEFEAMIKELDAPNVLSDIARSFHLKYAKASTLASILTQLFRGNSQRNQSFRDLFFGNTSTTGDPIASLRNITVVADDKSNTLLVTGPPQSFTMIDNIIAQLDKRSVQVFIEVAIVDVTLDDATKFGIEWTWKSDGKSPDGKNPRESVGPNFGLADEKFGLKYSIISNNLQALLHALTTRSNVKVYSTPSITTADNVAARISIGQDIPFVSSSEETNGGNFRQTVAFKNVSIALNVTPHVTEASNLLALDVQQTINELIGRELDLNAPIIANREARTSVMVNDGQTIVIGGIIKENKERTIKAVPFLSKIPLIGEAFKSRSQTDTKSELMVFLTPHILRDEQSVTEVTEKAQHKLSEPAPAIMPVVPETPEKP